MDGQESLTVWIGRTRKCNEQKLGRWSGPFIPNQHGVLEQVGTSVLSLNSEHAKLKQRWMPKKIEGQTDEKAWPGDNKQLLGYSGRLDMICFEAHWLLAGLGHQHAGHWRHGRPVSLCTPQCSSV